MKPIYKTDNIILTQFNKKIIDSKPTDKDYIESNYYDWWQDQEVTKYNSHGLFPLNIKELDSMIEQIENGKIIVWAILVEKETEWVGFESCDTQRTIIKHIGNISLQRIDWINHSAELAVVIGEQDYWGKGLTTEAASIIVKHGFEKMNLHRIWTGTARPNKGMRRVAEKLGMTNEGIFRDGVFLNGKYEEVMSFGLLRREFKDA